MILSMMGCESSGNNSPLRSQSETQPETLSSNLPASRPNVVLISIDTLRSDHLGAWGFPDGYSPTMDRLAAMGLIHQSMYTVIPHTTPAHASLLTGRYPKNHGSRDNAFPIDPTVPTLAEMFRFQGYVTAGSVGHFLISGGTSGLNRGFDQYWAPPEPGLKASVNNQGKKVFPLMSNEYRPWKEVNQHAETWLKTVQEPWFLFLHYYECHAVHNPPEPWRSIQDLHPYDGEVAGIDSAINHVLKMLADKDLLADTEIIITADHGESLGEHNYTGHGYGLYYPSMRTPWITWGGIHPAGVRTGLARIVDIMPTLLSHRKITVPQGIDGLADARGVQEVFGETPSLFPDEPQRRIRSLRNNQFTLIRRKNTHRTELYDRITDPAELADIGSLKPVVVTDFHETLDRFTAQDKPITFAPEEKLKPAVVEALKSLGYLN